MELNKLTDPALEFQHGEVTFLVKPKATAFDRLQVVMAHTPEDMLMRGIRQMVVGWKGIQSDGKPAAYSYEALLTMPEPVHDDSVLLKLATFIIDKTNIGAKGSSEPKNG